MEGNDNATNYKKGKCCFFFFSSPDISAVLSTVMMMVKYIIIYIYIFNYTIISFAITFYLIYFMYKAVCVFALFVNVSLSSNYGNSFLYLCYIVLSLTLISFILFIVGILMVINIKYV